MPIGNDGKPNWLQRLCGAERFRPPGPAADGSADDYTRPATWHDVQTTVRDEFTIDIMPSVAGISFAELERHIAWLDLDGEAVPVLDLAGLLKTKQGLRPKDQADARILREALRRLEGNS